MLELKINMKETNSASDIKSYDVVVIGGGPAGMTAALYLARADVKTLVLERLGTGGQAAITDNIENYPGFPEGVNGFALSQQMEEQARKFGAAFDFSEVSGIKKYGDKDFGVRTDSGEIRAKSVIIASGASSKRLGVPGEDKFIGKGVSFCATCDASFYRGKKVAVIGGGDSALDEGIFLTRFAEKVYIIHRRDALRAAKVTQKKALENPKIEFLWNTIVTEVRGDDKLRELGLSNVKSGELSSLAVDGMFLYVGLHPNTTFLAGTIELDEQGYVLTDENMETSVKGLFAAGDCRKTPLRQVVTAVSDGAVAAYSAEKYLG